MLNNKALSRRRSRNRGMSIVELLIGAAIGLFMLAGASLLFVGNVSNSRSLLLQARVDQNLQSTMDLIVRDLRRGAYWDNSLAGTNTTASVAASNPYLEVTTGGTSAAATIEYSYADSNLDPALAATVLTASRTFGFQLTGGKVQMNIGSGWQDLTDANVVTINTFTITPTTTEIDISGACASTCVGATCPKFTVRTYNVVLAGTSRVDSAITRSLTAQARVRNDAPSGICPA